jgi:transcription termination factor NusB
MWSSVFFSISIVFSLSQLLPANGFQRSSLSRININREALLIPPATQLHAKTTRTADKTTEKQAAQSSSTHRSTAVFALMESSKSKNFFAVRKLENDPGYLKLDKRDRAFARLILTTTERRQGQIDKVIQNFTTKTIDYNKVRIIVRILILILLS